jgi:predicted alpha/beta superfamily hydrolase
MIDSTYRTKPDRKHTIVGGSSAGGLISFMLVWEHPDIFSKAICMSPAFKSLSDDSWDYTETVRSTKVPRQSIFIYFDNGGIGLDSQLQPGINDMIYSLKSKGLVAGEDFIFMPDATGKHSEADWAKRFPYALISVLER